jgi:hypothetical protein
MNFKKNCIFQQIHTIAKACKVICRYCKHLHTVQTFFPNLKTLLFNYMGMIYFLTLGVDFSIKNKKNNYILGREWVLVLCMNIMGVKVNIQVVFSTIQTYHLRLTSNELIKIIHAVCMFLPLWVVIRSHLDRHVPTYTVFCDKHNIPFYLQLTLQHVSARYIGHLQGVIHSNVAT